jgi:RNA recognition motif-containing protein
VLEESDVEKIFSKFGKVDKIALKIDEGYIYFQDFISAYEAQKSMNNL